jgi:hypothetical protein
MDTPTFKDFFGQELAIGDEVVFCSQGYRQMKIGRIEKFTPKRVTVRYSEHQWGTYTTVTEFLIKKPV